MYRDTTLTNSQVTGTTAVPAFSLLNSGSRPVPQAGSIMYNLDNSLLYVSRGLGVGWTAVGSGTIPGPIHILDTTPSTTCDTGSLTTAGGVGIAGSVNICGTLSVAGGSTFGGMMNITNATDTSSPTTGALVIAGGLGIGLNLVCGGNTNLEGNLDVEGPIYANSPANAVSTTTGALIVAGGAGIGGSVFIGGNLIVDGFNTATQLATSTPGQPVTVNSTTPGGILNYGLITTEPGIATWQGLGGGAYITTVTNITPNLTAVGPGVWMYMQTGPVVSVRGTVTLQQTAAATDTFDITVPPGAPTPLVNFVDGNQAAGELSPASSVYLANMFDTFVVSVAATVTLRVQVDTSGTTHPLPLANYNISFMYNTNNLA